MTDLTAIIAERDALRAENERLKAAGVGYSQQTVNAITKERDDLRTRVAELSRIRCPDGVAHRWDGDGQCKECGNYATDLIDAALAGREE